MSSRVRAPVSGRPGSATCAGVAGHLAGGGEAAEELEAFLGGAAGFGGVGEHEPFRVRRQVHRLVGEFEVPYRRVVNAFDPGAVVADIVCGPAVPESIAAGNELS